MCYATIMVYFLYRDVICCRRCCGWRTALPSANQTPWVRAKVREQNDAGYHTVPYRIIHQCQVTKLPRAVTRIPPTHGLGRTEEGTAILVDMPCVPRATPLFTPGRRWCDARRLYLYFGDVQPNYGPTAGHCWWGCAYEVFGYACTRAPE